MCGISAIFAGGDTDLMRHILPMSTLVRHRGPDTEGYAVFSTDGKLQLFGGPDTPEETYCAAGPYFPKTPFPGEARGCAALGQRRLSILDLSLRGHQPLCCQDSRYWITFNGEIYNYLELRRELEKAGRRFFSNTDTEVVLAAYAEWGEACLSRFNGMWAFVIYDSRQRRIFAARDNFAIKPLYYWISPAGFVAFASEIKQFTVLPGWRAVLNGRRAYDFLNFATADHTRETLFAGVRQLGWGDCASFSISERFEAGGELPLSHWYKFAPAPLDLDFASATKSLLELLESSIRIRLKTDVPIGTALSGGLDSSSIACMSTRLLRETSLNARLKTFSACSDMARYDERKHIECVVDHCKAEPHYIYPTPQTALDYMDQAFWYYDEPHFSTSTYAQWNVFKLVAQSPVKVTLDGHGADELLAGYHPFFYARWTRLFKHLHWFELAKEISASKQRHGYGASFASARIANAILPMPLCLLMRRLTGKSIRIASWIDLKPLGLDKSEINCELIGNRSSDLNELSVEKLLFTSLPVQLHWADRDSMAHSIESRMPFLDPRLVEFVAGLPEEYKVSNGVTKQLLRNALRDILPETIRMRMDKLGFVTPENIWVKERLPDTFRNAVKKAVAESKGILNRQALSRAEGIISGKSPYSTFIWRIISFGDWMRRFNVNIDS